MTAGLVDSRGRALGRVDPAPTNHAMLGLVQTVDRLNNTTLKDLYDEVGITPPPISYAPSWASLERSELPQHQQHLLQAAQPRLSEPGTKVRDGRIEVEHNTRLRPWKVRGRLGNPGLNEEIYRSEPVVFKSVNEIGALICNASYDPHIPESMPPEVAREVERQDRAIKRAMMSCDWLNNNASFLKHGFSVNEIRWNRRTKTPEKLHFIEQASVYRWMFDPEMRDWIGTEFRTTGLGGGQSQYVLPNGDTMGTARTLLVNVYAQGNNLEGVSPVRVTIGLRKLKELILQSFGVSYQKYAVPIATIVHELTDASAAIIQQLGASDHKGEVQELISRIQSLRSRLGAVLPIPAGYKLEYQNPTTDMPDPKPLLEYIDTMIGLAFSNAGALLGSQSFGSYAMADVEDRKFMRSAPMYAGRIAHALTRLLHMGLRFSMPQAWADLEEWPRYEFRFNGTQDASKYLADLTLVANATGGTWTKEMREVAAAKLGLSPGALEDLAGDDVGDGSPSDDPEVADVEKSLDDAEESTDPIPDDLVSIREAAEALGVPTRTIGDMVRRGEVRFWQFGNRKQVSLREVLEQGARNAEPDEEE